MPTVRSIRTLARMARWRGGGRSWIEARSGGGSDSRRSAVRCELDRKTRQEDGPADDVDDPQQEAGGRQPDPAPGVGADAAHREEGQHDGDQAGDDPEQGDSRMAQISEAIASRLVRGLACRASGRSRRGSGSGSRAARRGAGVRRRGAGWRGRAPPG